MLDESAVHEVATLNVARPLLDIPAVLQTHYARVVAASFDIRSVLAERIIAVHEAEPVE